MRSRSKIDGQFKEKVPYKALYIHERVVSSSGQVSRAIGAHPCQYAATQGVPCVYPPSPDESDFLQQLLSTSGAVAFSFVRGEILLFL